MENIKKITIEIEKEFPDDPALQKIHIARKIILTEAEKKKVSYLTYIREEVKKIRKRAG
jgi:hypothetical protein